ncbi:GNAT family N-acetyltransferase [Ornithinibacillus californiensis]|uniref:GNAT family N-acetyltransferase n=1 Tax=Ornithinibacillus californiensis TaxID=161536 RepID=UPI0007EC5F62|nr:GNAT family N-acetyltransferase [Ornithinibacillus californiensis]
MKKFPIRYTSRLTLIEIEQQHVGAIFDILSKDDVTRYYGRESMKTIDEAEELVNHFHMLFQGGRGIRFGIVWKETQEFIGTIGIHNYSPAMKRAEIGFELHPDFWRKGILSEALASILEYCFVELGLYRVGAITFPDNLASNRLLEKAGFKQEGVLRGYLFQNNRSHDANVLSLLKPEWRRKQLEDEEPIQYTDYMTEIVKRSEAAGDFDDLPGKGKRLDLGPNYVNPSEAQLYKTLKDNHVLPQWVELANEIDKLKEQLPDLEGKERRKLIKEINKKIKAYNFACPPSLQKNKVAE